MEYTFTLKYRLAEHGSDPDALAECLCKVGCDDALVGTGQSERLTLEFIREAAPGFMGLTDVAEIVGVSRQNMRKLMLAHPDSFPAPVHEGSASIWHLADVLVWLQGRGSYALAQEILEVAQVAMQVNVAKERRRVTRQLSAELEALAG